MLASLGASGTVVRASHRYLIFYSHLGVLIIYGHLGIGRFCCRCVFVRGSSWLVRVFLLGFIFQKFLAFLGSFRCGLLFM